MEKPKKLLRLETGGLPLIHWAINRLNLSQIISKYIPKHGNESIPSTHSLLLMLYNMTLGRQPLYELEQWIKKLNSTSIGWKEIEHGKFNDDRFGRALDKLYWADRSSLMTEIVINMVEEFQVDLSRIHNDSTTIKAYGKILGTTRTGLELKKGYSKDHRPDLKQLVYCLSISADGAVPIHHKAYSGNRTDDTTHIETWNTILHITGTPKFLYVADCKVCTDKQLSHIVSRGGGVVTIIPETWNEVTAFKTVLRMKNKPKKIVLRKKIQANPLQNVKYEYFSLFDGDYRTKQGYRIYWIFSSEKKKRDKQARLEALSNTEKALSELNSRLNLRKLKNEIEINLAKEKILEKFKTKGFFHVKIHLTTERWKKQVGKGRPGPNAAYKEFKKTIYALTWSRSQVALKNELRVDGIFPLLSTDENVAGREALDAYKYQPRLEKRFTQFKSVHHGAPLLFKKIERVEATMFLFFLSLMIQSLIEREVRNKMEQNKIESLDIYPEYRDAYHPTTSKIMSNFEGISVYKVESKSKLIEEYQDELSATQKTILELLGIDADKYWG